MRRNLVAYALAGVVAYSVSIAAQYQPATPQTQPKTPTQTQAPTTTTASEAATVEGCLVREEDVPGRQPNVAEKAGVMEDYILTHAKVVKGTAPPAAAAPMRAGEATGTAGAMLEPMFDVKGLDGTHLKTFVGKRVQIDGTFADVEKSPSAKPTEDLVDIRGTAIRAASGECK